MNFSTASLSAAVVALSVAGPAAASNVEVLDLSGFSHGNIASGHSINGVNIAADNWNNDLDLAVVFDTTARRTADRDLEDRRGWRAGNLRGQRGEVGNVLIIQEENRNTRIVDQGRSVNIADDEGRRPAGELYFSFDEAITSFGFDLIDVEGTSEFRQGSGFFATFTDLTTTVSVAFRDLINPASKFYDSTVKFGDNSANRIQPITAGSLGLENFSSVTINLGGSGAVGNINYAKDRPPVAAPTPSAALAGLSLMGLVGVRRRRQA